MASLLQILEADLKKIAIVLGIVGPAVALADPADAAAIGAIVTAGKDVAIAQSLADSIQPFVKSVTATTNADGTPLTQEQVATKVTAAITNVSSALVTDGAVSGTTGNHVAVFANIVNAAVSASTL